MCHVKLVAFLTLWSPSQISLMHANHRVCAFVVDLLHECQMLNFCKSQYENIPILYSSFKFILKKGMRYMIALHDLTTNNVIRAAYERSIAIATMQSQTLTFNWMGKQCREQNVFCTIICEWICLFVFLCCMHRL